MVILIDTNVLIDFLTAREPFYDSAFQVMEKCASGKTKGYIAFHSLPNLWYIFRKVPEKTRRLWLEKLCKILRVTSTSHESILKAIKMENFKDFEDCLQDKCAEEISADYIITRNISDFENSIIPAIEPTDWLQKTLHVSSECFLLFHSRLYFKQVFLSYLVKLLSLCYSKCIHQCLSQYT